MNGRGTSHVYSGKPVRIQDLPQNGIDIRFQEKRHPSRSEAERLFQKGPGLPSQDGASSVGLGRGGSL